MIRWEFEIKSLDFVFKSEITIIKRCLGIIGSSYWQILHNPNPKPKLYIGLTFKRQVSLKRIKVSLEIIECIPLATTPILMVDCYWNPWRTKHYLSQGLLDYSHVSQSLSNFTCSNIKTSCLNPSLSLLKTSLFSFIFFMMFLNIVNSDLQNTLGIL